MTSRRHERPLSGNSRATDLSERRAASDVECSMTNIRKRRLVFKSETLIRSSKPHNSQRTSNRLETFHSFAASRRKRRRGKSSSDVYSRQWVSSSQYYSNYKNKVVIVSYNVLGVENASKHMDLYANVPPNFLEWDRRKGLLREEINNYNAGILCFQEVDRFNDLDDLFQNDGFKGVYKARTGEAHDGCAIFWKDKLFTLLHQEDIEFKRFGLRDNVAQLCVLEVNHEDLNSDSCSQRTVSPSTRNKRILVGNIHVLFNPNRGDIKLGQVRLFLDKAHQLSQQWGSIPVIIAGDLNSRPHSAIYEFLASSKLDIQLHDRRNMSGQLDIQSKCGVARSHIGNGASISTSVSRQSLYIWNKEELRLATGTEGVTHVWHYLELRSAYIGVPGNHETRDDVGEPLATSYHSKFMGTVDYIWHSKELVPVRVLETLPINVLKRTGGLPSEKLGSDHLALVCELAFKSYDNVS